MVPLVKRSADTLVELFGEKAGTGESIDILKYVGVPGSFMYIELNLGGPLAS